MMLVLAAVQLLAGCTGPVADWFKTDRTRLLGPEKVIRKPEGSPINPILGSIGPTDRSQELVPNAEFPREGDWSYSDEDYVIGPTDVLDISILDLFNEGLETVLRRQVSASGYVDLPLLPERIKAEGLTKDQLKDAVINAYSPDILRDPTISVTLAAQRQNTFSVLGAIARPGTYNILRKDMRLMEALALAGGITQSNIKYLYVIRPSPAERVTAEGGPARPGVTPMGPAELPELPEAIAPDTEPTTAPSPPPATQPGPGDDTDAALRELGEALGGDAKPPATAPATSPAPGVMRFSETGAAGSGGSGSGGGTKWIYSAGKWVRARPAEGPRTRPAPAPAGKPGEEDAADPFGWRELDKSDQARIVAINIDQLRSGDPRMNIVMRNNDIVQVPTLEVGEFYIMGEVVRPGVYSLTGRQITVKMAVAAAGNMNALAWPENSVLIRRIGGRQEQIIPLDLEAIFQGEDPDVFLKPNDVVAVGTDVRSNFFAVIRNAFRMSYGFGFIYDRNFADPQAFTPTSRRFTRW